MNTEKHIETKEDTEINSKKLKSNKGPYVLGEKLGEGAFAKVYLAKQIHIKEKCAVKILEKKLLESSHDIERLKKEIKILKKLRHKNIIQLYDIMESKRNLYFVMEYCKNGELFDYIVKKQRLVEPEACCFFQQIINGVEYLHNQGIIHRDLKPENLLLDDNNHIKISDFGLSTFFSKNNYLHTACGTPSYAPPEMLEGQEYNGEATDVWSCGIILYAMLCGSLPFSESKEEIIVKKIKMHDYIIPNYLSKDAKDLLNHILIINPKDRINIEQIKKHSWFNLIKPNLMKGIDLEKDIIPVDDKILDMVKSYGFDPEECRELLLKNKCCSLTTIYYLCLKKYVRENGKSISDLESDLFKEYINNPKNKINNSENIEEIKIQNNSNNKTEREELRKTFNHRMATKRLNIDKTNNNTLFNNKENKTPKLNYIKISKERKNFNNIKKNKKEYELNEITNHNNKTNNHNEKKRIILENEFNKSKRQSIKNENRNIDINTIINKKNKDNKENKKINMGNKNNSKTKNNKYNKKNININKNNEIITPINKNKTNHQTMRLKNNTKTNDDNKKKRNLINDQNSKPVKHETEAKLISSKYILNCENDNNKKNIKNNNSKNSIVNIININLNKSNSNNNHNIINNSNNGSFIISDKEISNIIKQKVKKINQMKNIEKNKKKEIMNNNSCKILLEEEELKNLLNPLYLKNLNTSTNNQKCNIANNINNKKININNSDLFTSIFQDSFINQTKTFIEVPQKYSIKTSNNSNVNNISRPKSSLFQYFENNNERSMLIKEEKPIIVINFIAKKMVANSFCGSFNFHHGHNTSHATTIYNKNINNSFFKNENKSNNLLNKSIANVENIIDNNNSFNNISISKDSLFINEDNNNIDVKDSNFKNLVSILNKKFKNYLSNEKMNNNKINNKRYKTKNTNTGSYKNFVIKINDSNKSLNNLKKDETKNTIFNSFSSQINNLKNHNNKNNSNSYLLFPYSKKNKNNKISLYKKNIQEKNKKNEMIKSSNNLPSEKLTLYNINKNKSSYNSILNLSTNNYPEIEGNRYSFEEKSFSIKKNKIKNINISPSHNIKNENSIITRNNTYIKKNSNCIKNKMMNLTKHNKNFKIITEDDEFKKFNKNKYNNLFKNKKKYLACKNKVTIDLSISGENINNNKKINSKRNSRIINKNIK